MTDAMTRGQGGNYDGFEARACLREGGGSGGLNPPLKFSDFFWEK